MQWTKNQQKVIDARNKNLLVSAAAGSGKTAVLVERILSRITDPVSPVDVDRLLVVTFTKAAAAEMRERVSNAIYKRIKENPNDYHLRKQQLYISNAMITTIDSFCLQVVREHFYQIELDPGFRIADQAEIKLLQGDVVKELLESRYEAADSSFLQFVESYVPGRRDAEIEEMILNIYSFSMSYPWPSEWLDACEAQYNDSTEQDRMDTPWMQYLNGYLNQLLAEITGMIKQALCIAQEEDGPNHYVPMLQSDLVMAEAVQAADFDERVRLLAGQSFMTLARKTVNEVDPDKKKQVMDLRNAVKKRFKQLAGKYYFQQSERMWEELKVSGKNAAVLLDLVREFTQRFQMAKREAGIVDFSDLEHFALDILVERTENGSFCPTEIAKAYSRQFEEVMIDEYQDSNFVQETILQSVSGMESGQHHMFMVGDVKQSIYRFRLARPELFLEKYHTYGTEDTVNQKIILDQNFRSRTQVLDMVNQLFYHCMTRAVGGIDYDAEHALYPGADYYETAGKEMEAELLLVETDGEADGKMEEAGGEVSSEEEETLGNKQLEAHAVAERISRLIEEQFPIYDKRTGKTRPCTLGDIVILLRSPKGYGDIFAEVLMAQGIAAICESRTGYFDSIEVVTVLNLLTVIDNPNQDIPMAAVMLSPIGRFSDSELAEITCDCRKHQFLYLAEELRQSHHPKAGILWERLERYRAMVPITPIYDLITYILEDTGYSYYAAALPSGTQRIANLEHLKQRAVAYEETQYRGLFHFIRYIQKIKEYEADAGETTAAEDMENAVRIMSIHGSKGLEFPIVFVSGLSKPFNKLDLTKRVVMEPDLGIGLDYRNPVTRQKGDTLIRQAIAAKIKMESMGEELRILYVALTRAREKLILTGNVKNAAQTMEKWNSGIQPQEPTISFQMLTEAQCFLDWIGSSYMKNRIKAALSVTVVSGVQLAAGVLAEQSSRSVRYAALTHWNTEQIYDAQSHAYLQEQAAYCYPYAAGQHIPIKYSVSDLKLAHMQDLEAEEFVYPQTEKEEQKHAEDVPDFIQGKKPLTGAGRGTAYHRIFELLDFQKNWSKSDLQVWLQELSEQGKLSALEAKAVKAEDFVRFSRSELYIRMRTADEAGRLYREQPFVMGIPANTVDSTYPQSETILIQGIMDAFFEESDGLVIVDYKTDRVETAKQLRDKYELQLDYYGKALTQITGKNIKERILYSVHLQETISC